MISIIIPVLNEAAVIADTLEPLQALRQRGHEVILVDAGSSDETLSIARQRVDRVLQSDRGRAVQMNLGAEHAGGDILWFLHADTRVPENVDHLIEDTLRHSGHSWGRFDVRLSGGHFLFRIIGLMINLRSCITGIATGDQGIFVKRQLFKQAGGYPVQPLMEDIELSFRLKRSGTPKCVHAKLVTSSRRWEQNGIVRTVMLMWYLRLRYALGTPAEQLVSRYYR